MATRPHQTLRCPPGTPVEGLAKGPRASQQEAALRPNRRQQAPLSGPLSPGPRRQRPLEGRALFLPTSRAQRPAARTCGALGCSSSSEAIASHVGSGAVTPSPRVTHPPPCRPHLAPEQGQSCIQEQGPGLGVGPAEPPPAPFPWPKGKALEEPRSQGPPATALEWPKSVTMATSPRSGGPLSLAAPWWLLPMQRAPEPTRDRAACSIPKSPQWGSATGLCFHAGTESGC